MSAKRSQADSSFSPITSPVSGSEDLRLTEPTDYIKPSNSTAYPLTGSCKTQGPFSVEVNGEIIKTDVICSGETFTTTIDTTSISSGSVSIRVFDTTKPSVESAVSVMKDTVAPSLIGSVTDGSYNNSTSQTPTLSWVSGSDAHSGIRTYEISLGTTAGGSDILSWNETGSTSASHIQSGLALVEGTTYYASIRAKDNAGNTSVVIQSDGWVVDATAPTLATSFTDGEIHFSSASSKVLNWVASTDASSGVSSYEVALGTTSGGTDVMNWTSVGNVITDTIDSLTLFGNRRYYASLRTVDVAGNRTASVMSDGWWNLRQSKKAVDTTNPQARWWSSSAQLGWSVAISEDETTMVVGAPGDGTDANGINEVSSAGAAFVYVKSGGVWIFQQKLVATGTNARVSGNGFGRSVAISGETIVVGAPGQGYDASGGGALVSGAGAAYVYVRSAGVWSQQQKLVATGTNARVVNDKFGRSVAISGETIVVGAPGQGYDASGGGAFVSGAGAAYVYVRSAGVWSQQQKLVATGTNARIMSDNFGLSVATSGETIVVGASGQDYDASGGGALVSGAGAAYVYVRSAGVWSQQQKLVATGTNARVLGDTFGLSVAISGETIVVGASGQGYDESGGGALVSGAGAAYVYVRSAGVWSQQQKLVATGTNARVASDSFGQSVAISGETIVVGASGQGYDASGGGASVSGAGAAYVYVTSAGVWSQQQKLVATGTNARVASDSFGQSVAISGETIVVGASGQDYDASGGGDEVSGAGAVFVSGQSVGVWTQEQKIVNNAPVSSRADLSVARYGEAVAISEDGNTLVVGAYQDDTDATNSNYASNAGAAYVYVKSGGNWVLQQKLVATGTNARVANDSFGRSVAISGETIVVGADKQAYDESGGGAAVSDAGAAYVYVRSAGVWSQQQKLVATGTNARVASDKFGRTVAISGETIVVGASGQAYDESGSGAAITSAGAAYVYVRSAGVWSQQQKLVATGTNARVVNDNFGLSVAISGETIVVGASGQGYDASGGGALVSGAGAAYVYVRSAGVWSQQQKLVATGTNARVVNDSFGQSVAISGETIVVGAAGQDYDESGSGAAITSAGAAYVYVRSAGVWSQQQKLVATGTNARMTFDNFGLRVAISGETIVVGARTQDYDSIGDTQVIDAGAAYVYRRTGSSWTQELKLTPIGINSRTDYMRFGAAVCISENEAADGYTIGVGATGDTYDSTGGGTSVTGAGSVFIFD